MISAIKRNKRGVYISLVLILLLGAFLRFYNIPDRYGFDYDATADAIVAYISAQELQLPLTGNFSSAGAFTFGPWYYYHLIFFQLLTGLVYGPWLLNGIISLLTIIIMFWIGKIIVDERLGILLALLTAVSPAQVVIGSMSSNPNIVAFYASIAFVAFIKIIQGTKNIWWAFIWGISLGIAINAHYQALNLLIFLIFILFFAKYEKIKLGIFSVIGLGVSFLPLLFFNLINHWHTLRNFIYYSLHTRGDIFVPNSWTIYLRDFWPDMIMGIFGVPYFAVYILGLGVIGVFIYMFYKRRLHMVFILSIIFMTFTFIYMRYYWGERHFVYYYYLYPIIFLLVGYAIYSLKNIKGGMITIFLTAILVIVGFTSSIKLLGSGNYGYIKKQAENIQKMYDGKKVSLYVCKQDDHTRANAIGYLLDHAGGVGNQEDIKLGFPGKFCQFPHHESFPVGVATPSAEILYKVYPIKKVFDGYDFSNASTAALLEAGWESVTPQKTYESEVRWWFHEQP